MYDEIKPRGATKASKPDAGGAVLRQVPVIGVVKDNIDPTRAGRLQVYISDLGGLDPNDSNTWVTVSYLTPFFGVTTPSSANTGYGTFTKNPNSYGLWNSPPDIGTSVICLFINGDPNYGFYIGAIPPAESLHMVPAIGGTDNIVANESEAKSYGGAVRLPVVNINTNNKGISDGANFLNEAKPVHSYAAGILAQQGLIRDPIRGVIGSTSQRESPSRLGWGVSTPGRPVYEGGFTDETIADAATGGGQQSGLKIVGRRGGHTLVMDDGDILGRDQLVRIRSSLGHQILMSDDGQTLFIIHANGQSYIELGKEGTIDMYATNSVNVRTQGDLNLHADNNINLNAAKALNISAESIQLESEKTLATKVGTDYTLEAAGKYTTKVDGAMSLSSAGDASIASSGLAYVNGSKINLNTGSSSLVPEQVKSLPRMAHTDTLNDAVKGWAAAPGKLLSIVSRAPAHSPWASANQGVDVKVDNSSSAALPAAPSATVAAANNTANETPVDNPVKVSVAATVPSSAAVSSELDKNTTGAMVAQMSTLAGTGVAADAVKLGAGVVKTATGDVASVGKLAQSPEQMEQAGILKPGSAALIAKLVAQGKTVEQAMTSNLFTGMPGAENLQEYIRNSKAQVDATVVNLGTAQKALINSGAVPPNLASTQLAGLVMSAATTGVANTLNFMKTAANSVVGQATKLVTGVIGSVTGPLNNLLGSTTNMISAGNFASGLAANLTGGLNSIATSLTGMAKGAVAGISGLLDSAKGIAGSAFAAITGAFPTLQAGVPQNIRDITEKAQAAAQSPGGGIGGALSGALGAVTGGLTGALGKVTGGITGALGTAVGAVTGGISTAVSSVVGSATGLLKTTLGATANLATGLGALPGGDKAVTAIAGSIVPGVAQVSGLINSATQITQGLSGITSISPLASGFALNAAQGIAGDLGKSLDKLKTGGESLASLASAGLPAGAASQLSAAISGMSSGGPIQILLATAASGTNNRSQLTSQLQGVLGTVPLPNYSGNPATLGKTAGESALDKIKENLKQLNQVTEEISAQKIVIANSTAALKTAVESLPEGDPGIETAKEDYKAQKLKMLALLKKSDELTNQANKLV